MASAAAPHPIRRNSAEAEIDQAVHRVFLQYGPDLGAFFRAVQSRAGNEAVQVAAGKPSTAAKKIVKSR